MIGISLYSKLINLLAFERRQAFLYSIAASLAPAFCKESISQEFDEHADVELEHVEIIQNHLRALDLFIDNLDISIPFYTNFEAVLFDIARYENEGVLLWHDLLQNLSEGDPFIYVVEGILEEESEHLDDSRIWVRELASFGKSIQNSTDPIKSESQKRAVSKRPRGPDGKFIKRNVITQDKKVKGKDKDDSKEDLDELEAKRKEQQEATPAKYNPSKIIDQTVNQARKDPKFFNKQAQEHVKKSDTRPIDRPELNQNQEKVIGFTDSGSPISSDPFSPDHANFTSEDFEVASNLCKLTSEQFYQAGDQVNGFDMEQKSEVFDSLAKESQPPFNRFIQRIQSSGLDDEFYELPEPVEFNQNTKNPKFAERPVFKSLR